MPNSRLAAAAKYKQNGSVQRATEPSVLNQFSIPLEELPCSRFLLNIETVTSPTHDQIVDIHTTDTRCEVPTSSSAISLGVGGVAGGKNTVGAAWAVAIIGACAVHIHIALSHIVEYAGGSYGVAVAGVARCATASAVFSLGQRIQNRVRVTLLCADVLIHQ